MDLINKGIVDFCFNSIGCKMHVVTVDLLNDVSTMKARSFLITEQAKFVGLKPFKQAESNLSGFWNDMAQVLSVLSL